MTPLATGLLLLTLIVDQLEGEVAAVETEDLELHFLPLDLLPEGTREGDQLEIRVQRVERPPASRGRPTTRRADGPTNKVQEPKSAKGEER